MALLMKFIIFTLFIFFTSCASTKNNSEESIIDKFNIGLTNLENEKYLQSQSDFKNVLISDDISMKALRYSIKQNTIRSFDAGCNIVLHCNAKLSEMLEVAKNSPKLNSFLMKKTKEFYKLVS